MSRRGYLSAAIAALALSGTLYSTPLSPLISYRHRSEPRTPDESRQRKRYLERQARKQERKHRK